MASKESVYNYGAVGRDSIPSSPNADNTQVAVRMDGYGGQYVQQTLPGRAALAAQGSLFSFRHTTFDASTNIPGHPAPVLADIDDTLVKPIVFLRNKTASTQRKRLWLLSLEIYVVTAGASGTNKLFAFEIDSGATRYSSGGSALTVCNVNPQSSESLADVLTAYGGAVVATAETAACRKLRRGKIRPSIEVAGDRTIFEFGSDVRTFPPAAAAAAVRTDVIHGPAIPLGPSDSFLLGIAADSQNAAGVYELYGELAWL